MAGEGASEPRREIRLWSTETESRTRLKVIKETQGEEETAQEFASKTKDFSHGTPNYPPIIQFVDYSDQVNCVDVFTSARAFLDSLLTQTRLFT